jgi:monomeric isocitrate dehydrogenase
VLRTVGYAEIKIIWTWTDEALPGDPVLSPKKAFTKGLGISLEGGTLLAGRIRQFSDYLSEQRIPTA